MLDGRRLCDLHMSCCNLRGKGWGKRNVAINYIYDDPLGEDALAVYHHMVLKEMERRGYKYDSAWIIASYCGKNRPERTASWNNYREAHLRGVPLQGHTVEMYLNDIQTLKDRGLDIKMSGYTIFNDGTRRVVLKAKCNERETIYVVKVEEMC